MSNRNFFFKKQGKLRYPMLRISVNVEIKVLKM